MGRSQRITDWNPEDAAAWEGGNKDTARRIPHLMPYGRHRHRPRRNPCSQARVARV